MKVAVIGSGGREHTLAWSLVRSPEVSHCYCLPGNGGTAGLPKTENVAIAVDQLTEICQFCQTENIDLVVVGPELPLTLGLADQLQDLSIKVFGPTKAGAELEASKSWTKQLLLEAGVPTAFGETFTTPEPAQAYADKMGAPIVVKADGLAAGKGVIVAQTLAEAKAAIAELFDQGFEKIVVEEFLPGQEVSVLALCDGKTVIPLLPAQDHKRIGEGDQGLNTGGMGAYCPAPIAPSAVIERVQKQILEPTAEALGKRGIDYRGVLYAGLMVSPDGDIKVLEYNCRFGDPETQAVLPLLATPLEKVLMACVEQTLDELGPLRWHPGSAVCVVVAAGGYPGSYRKGDEISGLSQAEARGVTVFHAGTEFKEGKILSNGGRVLGVTALGEDLPTAIATVYQGVGQIEFEGMYYRRDIGHKALS
ncbi:MULTISPECIES: phosphoribosylamine--glycine ligase [unclassified Synechocystis]|uniref:phosphoribosylamine--glycine ligase n=1 Tax=unclassified Synechocystis TaxID=2640012 RepID=UPI000414ECE7|nr:MULTISPECIES: phosphoribosylamine--glycine ligase [unclassified Synechocystis]AIE75184.1 Phosphoribosylamine--glycine ligase [Synechocystis sp. PCC 6714]MCT0252946.1 phosphoribosylamine--glycine ligase [Synechocystis sp. CS-94]